MYPPLLFCARQKEKNLLCGYYAYLFMHPSIGASGRFSLS